MIEAQLVLLPTPRSIERPMDYKNGRIIGLDGQPQHLYFTNNQVVKEGDWIRNGYSIWQATKEDVGKIMTVILAATEELGLPTIPQSFLQAYVKAQGKIDKVWLEQEDNHASGLLLSGHPIMDFSITNNYPKLDPQGNVVLSIVPEEKKSAEKILGASSNAFISDHLRSLLEDRDKELEDALSSYMKTNHWGGSGDQAQYDAINSIIRKHFSAGYKAAEEKMSEDVTEFAEWLVNSPFTYGDKHTWSFDIESRTTKQLYQLWKTRTK